MNKAEYLLTQLVSECVEVAHRATKVLHFGITEVQDGQPFNNHDRLMGEVYDLMGTLSLLNDEGIIKVDVSEKANDAIQAKKIKVLKYLDYADKHCGTISPRLKRPPRQRRATDVET